MKKIALIDGVRYKNAKTLKEAMEMHLKTKEFIITKLDEKSITAHSGRSLIFGRWIKDFNQYRKEELERGCNRLMKDLKCD